MKNKLKNKMKKQNGEQRWKKNPNSGGRRWRLSRQMSAVRRPPPPLPSPLPPPPPPLPTSPSSITQLRLP